jgi:hypothetical protein
MSARRKIAPECFYSLLRLDARVKGWKARKLNNLEIRKIMSVSIMIDDVEKRRRMFVRCAGMEVATEVLGARSFYLHRV